MLDIKKRYKLVFIGFVIMTVLNLVIIATLWFNRPPWIGGDHDSLRMNTAQHMFMKRLDLDEKQVETFQELRESYRMKIRATVEEIQGNRKKLYNAIGSIDSLKVDSLASAIADGHKQIEMINISHFNELRGRLNDQQKKKFDQIIRRMANFMLRRPGNRPMPNNKSGKIRN